MWMPDFTVRKRVRHYEGGEARFLTFSCYRGLPLLSKDRSRLWFLDALRDAREKHRFDLWAWVIMPEHVHLLIWPKHSDLKPGTTIGSGEGILTSIKSPVGRKAINYLEQFAPGFLEQLTVVNAHRVYRHFWQPGPGFDENVSNAGVLRDIIDYIHMNPVRRGLVENPVDWPWSSARDWAGLPWDGLRVDRNLPETFMVPWQSDRSLI